MIVITDLPKNALIHTTEIKKLLTELQEIFDGERQVRPTKKKLRTIELILNTLDDKPKRIQLSRKKGYRKPPGAVNVARPTKWGNPFNWQDIAIQPGYETQKELAVREYSYWLEGRSPYGGCHPKERQWILDHIQELAGKDLACWCKPGDCCHADVLLRMANKPPF